MVVDQTKHVRIDRIGPGWIEIEKPVGTPSEVLRVQVESVYGTLSNSLFLRYVDHLQINQVSSDLIYVDVEA